MQPSRLKFPVATNRLKYTQFGANLLIVILGLALLFQLFFAQTTFWLLLLRVILGSLLLTLAVTDNMLRCCQPTELVDDKNIPAAEPSPFLHNRFSLPTGLTQRLDYLFRHLLFTVCLTLLAFWGCACNLAKTEQLIFPETLSVPVVVLLLAGCFVLLVYERMCSDAKMKSEYQPEVVGLCRINLNIWLLASVAVLFSAILPNTALWILRLTSLLILLVSAEFLCRLLAALFYLTPGLNTPRFLTLSLLTSFYHWPLRPGDFLLEKIEHHLGVDLSQIQSFKIIKRLCLPILGSVALLGWLSSSLINISLQQRGVYERTGQPVAVLKPGLHLGLPWPLGKIRLVEYGAVHELQTSDMPDHREQLEIDRAEAPAPQSSWRLWDTSHPGDQSQMIASETNSQQGFQIMDMDVRLIWRIGLTDQAALDSVYQAAQLPDIIRNVARQVLVSYFASQQLDNLLSEQQNTLATKLNQQIQHRLDRLNTGVELLFTRIESIHPPIGVADAYHGVQAAQIAAKALIEREHGYAASQNSNAEINALIDLEQAQAVSAERIAQAHRDSAQFSAEYKAWKHTGSVFVTERQFQILRQSLANTPLLILDSRLRNENAPMLDFRAPSFMNNLVEQPKAKAK